MLSMLAAERLSPSNRISRGISKFRRDPRDVSQDYKPSMSRFLLLSDLD
jgi:hypothetical protein